MLVNLSNRFSLSDEARSAFRFTSLSQSRGRPPRLVLSAMPVAAHVERALLDMFGLENTVEGRRDLVASLRTAADEVESCSERSSEGSPPPHGEAEVVSTTGKVNEMNLSSPKPKRDVREFDVASYPSAHVALRVMYAGWQYHGFAQQGAETSGVATVEGALFAALRRTKLIGHDSTWEDVEYTRCGRTDAGVSALGQVVSLRLRSKRGVGAEEGIREAGDEETNANTDGDENTSKYIDTQSTSDDLSNRENRAQRKHPPAPSAQKNETDEHDYVALLNRALPDDIRVLGSSYVDPKFSARFDCEKRIYKYFFCKWLEDNLSNESTDGTTLNTHTTTHATTDTSSGLDLDLMRLAAKKFEGEHDFRNVCKMDAKNVHNYRREVYKCEVVDCDGDETEWRHGGANGGAGASGFVGGAMGKKSQTSPGAPPGLCYISIEGSAFLWHQVRYMATVLFLVGLGREDVSVVDQLLDVQKTKRKPQYEMAPDEPLVLWRCGFPKDTLKLTTSAAARAQLQAHSAKQLATHLRRAGVWAETWCDLNLHDSERGDDSGNTSGNIAGDVLAAVCCLSAPGKVGGGIGVSAKAAHVPLMRRETEPTYDERRARLLEKGKK